MDFDKQFIARAVRKACESAKTNEELIDDIAQAVALDSDTWPEEVIDIETVQDRVEKTLIKLGHSDVAKAYILYRQKRTDHREAHTKLMNKIESFVTGKETKGSTHRENANIATSTNAGAFYRIGSEASKDYYLSNLIPEEFVKAREDNHIYYHDLDQYGLSINCMQHDLSSMFKRGFKSGNAYMSEPKHISVAMELTNLILQSAQNDLFGGEAVPAWDYYMEPYVEITFQRNLKKNLLRLGFSPVTTEQYCKENFYQEHTPVFEDDLLYKAYSWAKQDTEEETYQAAQAMVFNANSTASRIGGQQTFASLSFGTCTKPGGRLAVKALLNALDKGIGKGVTSIFPICAFKLKSGVSYDPTDINYDLRLLAEKTTAKRMFPCYTNLDAPYNLQYYKAGHPETEAVYMGMVAGNAEIAIYLEDIKLEATFERIWNLFATLLNVNDFDENTQWIDLSKLNVKSEIDTGNYKFTRIKKIMRCSKPAKGECWKKVAGYYGPVREDIPSNYNELWLTSDHPLSIYGKGRTMVKDLVVGDKINYADDSEYKFTITDITDLIEYTGYGYDFETESDTFNLEGLLSHNCRTRLIGNVNGPEIVTGRGNLSFTTIGLPRLALESREAEEDQEKRVALFFSKLDDAMDVARRQLFHRFDIQKKRHVYNFPYVMRNGAYMGSEYLSPEDTIEKALMNGSLTIGYVGLAETLRALVGHDHSEGDEYQQLGLKIVKHMRDFCDKVQEETHMNFSLIATPAESVAGTMLRKDKAKYGVIEGITDKEFYTNSNHVPVEKKIRASEKIRIEAPYHWYTNAGHILYVEQEGDPTKNPEALHSLVSQCHDAGAGYFAFNSKMDTCTACGYVGLIQDTCPSCGAKDTPEHPFSRPRRITGYISYLDRFNDAKRAEESMRVAHA